MVASQFDTGEANLQRQIYSQSMAAKVARLGIRKASRSQPFPNSCPMKPPLDPRSTGTASGELDSQPNHGRSAQLHARPTLRRGRALLRPTPGGGCGPWVPSGHCTREGLEVGAMNWGQEWLIRSFVLSIPGVA